MEGTSVVTKEPEPVMDNAPQLEAVEIPLPAAFTKYYNNPALYLLL